MGEEGNVIESVERKKLMLYPKKGGGMLILINVVLALKRIEDGRITKAVIECEPTVKTQKGKLQ